MTGLMRRPAASMTRVVHCHWREWATWCHDGLQACHLRPLVPWVLNWLGTLVAVAASYSFRPPSSPRKSDPTMVADIATPRSQHGQPPPRATTPHEGHATGSTPPWARPWRHVPRRPCAVVEEKLRHQSPWIDPAVSYKLWGGGATNQQLDGREVAVLPSHADSPSIRLQHTPKEGESPAAWVVPATSSDSCAARSVGLGAVMPRVSCYRPSHPRDNAGTSKALTNSLIALYLYLYIKS
jgi:hypothetical protein